MNEQTAEDVCCAVCGKGLWYENTGAILAAMIITVPGENTPFSPAFVDRQLGVYAGKERWYICYECWLKTFGIKPSIGEKIDDQKHG